MIAARATAALLGGVFGFLLAWAGLSDPDAIRRMLLLQDAYLFLVFFSAVAVAFAGVHALSLRRQRALLTRERIALSRTRPSRRHLSGSVVFGVGWAISSSCPGPIAAQLGQGMFWSVFTIVGIVVGIVLYSRREQARSARLTEDRASSGGVAVAAASERS